MLMTPKSLQNVSCNISSLPFVQQAFWAPICILFYPNKFSDSDANIQLHLSSFVIPGHKILGLLWDRQWTLSSTNELERYLCFEDFSNLIYEISYVSVKIAWISDLYWGIWGWPVFSACSIFFRSLLIFYQQNN